MEEKNEQKEMTPSQYFDYLKNAKQTVTTEALKASFGTFIALAEKYKKLGQKKSLQKLCFLADTLQKEERLLELGVDTFIYRDVIEDYIENVADKAVKIVELSRYMREIPDELVPVVTQAREIFDEIYVVFTDYTGFAERQIAQERKDKDPILFGVFKKSDTVCDRFYFLGDWVDEYCDLTLDKMIDEYTAEKGVAPHNAIAVPADSSELVEMLKAYQSDTTDKTSSILQSNDADTLLTPYFHLTNDPQPRSFFGKIRAAVKSLIKK